MSWSFTPFARMRPKNFVLANFANRRTCLSTQYQNYALKLKMLRKYTGIPTNPEAYVKYSDQIISSIIDNIKQQDFTYDIGKKVEVVYKGKTSKKMKMITQTISHAQFKALLQKDTATFRSHISRTAVQFREQKYLKENLSPNHVYIHMDFAEDYGCRSQNEIQSVYWSPIQITIHPAVMYYKTQNSAESSHKSFVFISNESRHDAMFVYIIIDKLVLLLKEIVPYLEMVHYWTNSPTSQHRNRSIFQIISYHKEYRFSLKFQKDSCCQDWRECLLTTLSKNQRKDASEKICDQIKEPSKVVIEDSQSTSIVPKSSDYVTAIYSGKPYVGQVEETDGEGEEMQINFLEHRGDLQRLWHHLYSWGAYTN